MALVNDELKPFLKASAATHLCLVGAAIFLTGIAPRASREVYRIDFIGPTAGIANREAEGGPGAPAAAARAAGPVAPERKAPEFSRRHRSAPLPRPSFLGPAETKTAAEKTSAIPAPAPAPSLPAAHAPPGSGGQGDGTGANVSADLPNFPYPWYITQVRAQLWNRWSTQIPATPGAVVVMFTIMRNGALTDVRVESSSGDDTYDYTALTAVQEAAPFPPLPTGFPDSFLKIHVRFTS